MPATRKSNQPYRVSREQAVRLWFERQALSAPRGRPFTKRALTGLLERTGGLQLDSVNVLDRAHYITLWSRFGNYDRAQLDRWVYKDKLAQDYMAHEACLVPPSRLPLSRRRMLNFDGSASYWDRLREDPGIERRILARIRREGPLESSDFKGSPGQVGAWWEWREEKLGLEYLYRKGKLAVRERRSFRRVFDLGSRVLPAGRSASQRAFEESWLLQGLAANGVASERHLLNYLTLPEPKAPVRRELIARNLRSKRIVTVEVEGLPGPCFALPAMLEGLDKLPAPHGTNLLCPFDSFLWQRRRAEDLLDFTYRIEIYVPAPKRRYGYYVLPILHEGRLVGRLDPKFDRQANRFLVRAIQLEEPALKRDAVFRAGLAETLRDLAVWLGAGAIDLPRGWGTLLR